MLNAFAVSVYTFRCRVTASLGLPVYKGSVLRGGLGHHLRTLCCSVPNGTCPSCPLHSTCPYALLFEPSPPEGADRLSRNRNIPPPFVLEPPEDARTVYAPGDRFAFDLVLVGKAISFLPYFLLSFRRLGEDGLGRGRGRFHLERIVVRHPWSGEEREVYSDRDELVHTAELPVKFGDVPEERATRVSVDLLTPLRLTYEGKLVSEGPAFHVLYRNVLRRLSSLAYFHCGEPLELDYPGEIARAEGVRTVENRTGWWDWTRYSSSQKVKMRLGGLKGTVVYEGALTPFLPFLRLAEVVHVGKNCTFGLGKIRVNVERTA